MQDWWLAIHMSFDLVRYNTWASLGSAAHMLAPVVQRRAMHVEDVTRCDPLLHVAGANKPQLHPAQHDPKS